MTNGIDLIVGLGNPGAQYERTRHNVGAWLLDELAQQGASLRAEGKFQAVLGTLRLAGRAVVLLKPTTFMNHSGQAVGAYARYYKIEPAAILVLHDELDLPPGTVRLKAGGGHGGHNGLRDIAAQIGTEFLRLRIGIGHPGSADQVVNYVLGSPSLEDRLAIDQAIERGLEGMPEIVAGQADKIMNQLNRRADATGKK
jgi:PTH1 family peptidyl-tRNA hydrolase